jgi:L-threonylcarbamoyladenylate synthase
MSAIFSSITDQQLIGMLRSGKVGVIPTDTVYGLAAAAVDPEAVARLYALKNREKKPGTIIAASTKQLIDLGFDVAVVQSVAHFWPNPLSVVVPLSPEYAYIDQGVGSVAVRIPKSKRIRTLLEQTGPLVTSSANHPGKPPASTLTEAEVYFRDQVDFYVDGGDRSDLPPSTIVRYDDGHLTVLRQGAVHVNEKGEIV